MHFTCTYIHRCILFSPIFSSFFSKRPSLCAAVFLEGEKAGDRKKQQEAPKPFTFNTPLGYPTITTYHTPYNHTTTTLDNESLKTMTQTREIVVSAETLLAPKNPTKSRAASPNANNNSPSKQSTTASPSPSPIKKQIQQLVKADSRQLVKAPSSSLPGTFPPAADNSITNINDESPPEAIASTSIGLPFLNLPSGTPQPDVNQSLDSPLLSSTPTATSPSKKPFASLNINTLSSQTPPPGSINNNNAAAPSPTRLWRANLANIAKNSSATTATTPMSPNRGVSIPREEFQILMNRLAFLEGKIQYLESTVVPTCQVIREKQEQIDVHVQSRLDEVNNLAKRVVAQSESQSQSITAISVVDESNGQVTSTKSTSKTTGITGMARSFAVQLFKRFLLRSLWGLILFLYARKLRKESIKIVGKLEEWTRNQMRAVTVAAQRDQDLKLMATKWMVEAWVRLGPYVNKLLK